ncbi:hypothetical protein ACFPIF_17750 [Brevundimonas faecalis]
MTRQICTTRRADATQRLQARRLHEEMTAGIAMDSPLDGPR